MSDSDVSSDYGDAGVSSSSSSKGSALAKHDGDVDALLAEAGASPVDAASAADLSPLSDTDTSGAVDDSAGAEADESGDSSEPESGSAGGDTSSSWRSRVRSVSRSSWSFASRSTSSSHSASDDAEPLVTDPARLLYKDPVFWFSCFCLVIPTVRNCADLNEVWAFYTNKAIVLCIALGYLVSQHLAKASVRLSACDTYLANWALVNGCFFHLTMDGMSGWLKWLGPMSTEYDRLDRRFITMDPAPIVVTIMEVFWHMPACLLAYRGIVQNRKDRQFWAIVMSIFQIAGCVVFYGSEMYAGLVNLPTERPIGGPDGWFQNAEFTLHHLIYFWFATVFCSALWVIVPALVLKDAFKSIVADFSLKRD